MAVTTLTTKRDRFRSATDIQSAVHTEQGTANTLLVSTIPAVVGPQRLSHVAVKYSAAPTHAGVTVELDSAAGAAFDVQIDASPANAQDYVFVPAHPIVFAEGDAIRVTAPAGGVAVTAAVSVYMLDA